SKNTILFVRLGIVIGIMISLFLGYRLPISIVARATAMFFGIAAATFLPMFMLGIYWKGVTRAGAVAGMLVGASSALFWLVFIHAKEAEPLGICQALFDEPVLISSSPWPVIDPIVIGLPMALVVTIMVSLFTRSFESSHIKACFQGV
ncbi:MAG TPA: sodium:solute symporter family protein, partial [Desulfohalobiaceae bacterium]|nr:sodium:solute symporter family protein [Desulfohalobiaceae bacterium]